MKILLVDDNQIHLLILKKIFDTSFDEVVLAHNGKEALQHLEFDSEFHVILTDIMMPVMDGMEFLEHLKESPCTRGIPTVGFTAGDLAEIREKSKNSFDKLVAKPLDFYELYHLAKSTAKPQIH